MGFRKSFRFVQYPGASDTPDPDTRPLHRRVRDAFHDNNADIMAVTIRLGRGVGVTLDIELTDTPPPARFFPCAYEDINENGVSCAAVIGFILNRRDFHRKKSAFGQFENAIKNTPLFAVI